MFHKRFLEFHFRVVAYGSWTKSHGDANERSSAAQCQDGQDGATERFVYPDRDCTAYITCGNPLLRWKENGYVTHKANGARVKETLILKAK
jgi:hypothetical protein